jgi:hypothetical protein
MKVDFNAGENAKSILAYTSLVRGEGREQGKSKLMKWVRSSSVFLAWCIVLINISERIPYISSIRHFIPVQLTPDIDFYYYTSSSLIDFVRQEKEQQQIPSWEGEVTHAVLYSQEGMKNRNEIKHDLEEKISKRTTKICLLTCGLACCCGGPCGCCDNSSDIQNLGDEEYYCNELRKRYPNNVNKNDKQINFESQINHAVVVADVMMDDPIGDFSFRK